MDYELLDSGLGRKLERFGPYILDRPALGAIWKPELSKTKWEQAHAQFTREGQNNWKGLANLPAQWSIEVGGIQFKLAPTDFGHLGIFPEQRAFWHWIETTLKTHSGPLQVLNLFAYSGGATLAAAKGNTSVCHLDASKGMVAWARENAALNQLDQSPIRWIVEDVTRFLKRELKRGKHYDALILDPPSFGRGAKGEVFKIEENLPEILDLCQALLSSQPAFVLLSCHTPGLTPTSLRHLLEQMMVGKKGKYEAGEMLLTGQLGVRAIPSGTYAKWSSS